MFAFILVVSLVHGAEIKDIEFGEEDQYEVTLLEKDAAQFTYLDKYVRIVMREFKPRTGELTVRVYVTEVGESLIDPLNIVIRKGKSVGFRLDDDVDEDLYLHYGKGGVDESTIVLSKNGVIDRSAFVDDLTEVVTTLNDGSTTTLTEESGIKISGSAIDNPFDGAEVSSSKKVIVVAGIVIAVILLYFIFKGEESDLKKDEIEGGIIVDGTKK